MFIIKCSFDKKKGNNFRCGSKIMKDKSNSRIDDFNFFFIMICIKPDFFHITLHLSQYNPIKIR